MLISAIMLIDNLEEVYSSWHTKLLTLVLLVALALLAAPSRRSPKVTASTKSTLICALAAALALRPAR